MTLKKFLEINNFKKFAKPFELKDKLKIGCEEKNMFKGWIYVFVIEKHNNPLLVIYIGKTIGTLYSRMKNGHEYGAIKDKNKKGNANAKCMEPFINSKEYTISGYGKMSCKIYILNSEVSLCEAEELAFKKIFSENGCNKLLLNDKTSKDLGKEKKWLKDVKEKLASNSFYKVLPLEKSYKLLPCGSSNI